MDGERRRIRDGIIMHNESEMRNWSSEFVFQWGFARKGAVPKLLLGDVGCWKQRLRSFTAPGCVCAAPAAAAPEQELLCKQDNKCDPETALH